MENSEDLAADKGKSVFRLVGVILMPIGLLFLLVGVGSLVFGWISWKADQAAKTWPSVKGQVVGHNIEESETRDSDGYTEEHYTPKVIYQYEVDGKTYESDRMAPTFEQSYSRYEEAEAVLNSYPENARVEVFYQPDDPGRAVLKVDGGSTGAWIAGILGAVFALFGGVFSLVGLFLFRKFR